MNQKTIIQTVVNQMTVVQTAVIQTTVIQTAFGFLALFLVFTIWSAFVIAEPATMQTMASITALIVIKTPSMAMMFGPNERRYSELPKNQIKAPTNNTVLMTAPLNEATIKEKSLVRSILASARKIHATNRPIRIRGTMEIGRAHV